MPSVQRRSDLPAAAMRAVARGWPVFPCEPGGKRPCIDRWEERATADLEVVERAWSGRWSGYNFGIACRHDLVVVDLDCHGDLPEAWRLPGIRDGRDVFALLLEWAGETQLQDTYWVRTPSGGWHLYFEAPGDGPEIRNSAGMLGPGVDIRGAGGYVVGAGSVIGGQVYELLDDRAPAPLPAWLRRRLQPQPATRASSSSPGQDGPANLRGLVDTVRNAQPGQRTGTLVWAAHRLRDEISAGRASLRDGELLVRAAVAAGIRGGERYADYQVDHVLKGAK